MLHHLLALVPLVPGPAAAQEPLVVAPPGPQDAATTTTRPAPDRRARRVLRTTSGAVLRGMTRRQKEGDGWQVKSQRGWVDVPDIAVEDVKLEKELLDQFATTATSKKMTPGEKLAWAFESGLLKEAFELGDRLLEASPRDAELRLACAQATRYVAGVPERGADDELEVLRELGQQGSAVVREAIVERLLTAAPRAEVLAALHQDLKSKRAGTRVFATFALGRLFPTEDPRALLLHAMWDPSGEARIAASRAVGEVGAKNIAAPLVNALASKNGETRMRAAEALGYADDDSFVAPLMDRMYMLRSTAAAGGSSMRPPHSYIFVGTQTAYVQDFDVEVAQFAAVGDPVINTLLEGSVLDAGVIGVDRVSRRNEPTVVRNALGRIVGAGDRRTVRDWIDWWENDESAGKYRRKLGQGSAPAIDIENGR